jgi:hypothetical protein
MWVKTDVAGIGRKIGSVLGWPMNYGNSIAHKSREIGQFAYPQPAGQAPDVLICGDDVKRGSALLDKSGKVVATVTVKLTPEKQCGDFRISSSADLDAILKNSVTLRTPEGGHYKLIGLHRCPALHLMDPASPHLEFEFEPVASV